MHKCGSGEPQIERLTAAGRESAREDLEERRLEGTRVRCLEAEEPRGKNGDRPPRDCPLCRCGVRTWAAERKTPQRLEGAQLADPAPRGGRLRRDGTRLKPPPPLL